MAALAHYSALMLVLFPHGLLFIKIEGRKEARKEGSRYLDSLRLALFQSITKFIFLLKNNLQYCAVAVGGQYYEFLTFFDFITGCPLGP